MCVITCIKLFFFLYVKEQTQRCGQIVFRTFDPVTVQLSLDSSNVQHERIVLKLVKPEIPNFSIPSTISSTIVVPNTLKTPPSSEPSNQPQSKKAKL